MMVRPDRGAGRRNGDAAPGTRVGRLRLRPALDAQVGYTTEVLSPQPEDTRIGIEQELYSAGGSGLDRRAS